MNVLRAFLCVFALLLPAVEATPADGGVRPYVIADSGKAYVIDVLRPPSFSPRQQKTVYRVVVQKDPWSMRVERNGEVIAENASPAVRFQARGARHELGAVRRVVHREDARVLDIDFYVGTGDTDTEMLVRLTAGPEVLGFSASVSPDSVSREATDFETNFLLASSGHWYGANVTSGHNWPLEAGQIELDPFLATSNQTSPIWLASRGAAFYTDGDGGERLGFSLNQKGNGLFSLRQRKLAWLQIAIGDDIVSAWGRMMNARRPQRTPPRGYFTKPIFNTWIEYLTAVNQKGVLDYARKIRAAGFPCEVLDIDDRWQSAYGDWSFDREKFPNPKAMMDELHAMGFKVALWAVPFVNRNARNYEFLEKSRYLIMSADGGSPYTLRWWNGEAGQVDFSNPQAYRWYVGQLKELQAKYGVDGFKLDGGDAEYLNRPFQAYKRISANQYTDLYAMVGTEFAINELRVGWLSQKYGLVERLRDKNSNWSRESGLASLIPHGLTESLLGYMYFCPDMIGGGLDDDWKEKGARMDPELFVRWAEASALMPMMQFSYAPWRLDERYAKIVLRYARLHEEVGDYIYQLAVQARRPAPNIVHGDFSPTSRFTPTLPIARPLFFLDPSDARAYTVDDEFMLGDKYLVAPVLQKSAVARDVYLPRGQWKDYWTGKLYDGGRSLESYPAPLDVLPIFVRSAAAN